MKELFDKMEGHLVTHLWDIERDVDDRGGFKCPQQIDDVKDCLMSLKAMRELLSLV